MLPRSFFDRPAVQVAPELLGCVIEHETAEGLVAVVLAEVEAYAGESDPASHAFRGRTARVEVMYGPPGHAYVYFTYGMHFCVNLVCQPVGQPSAVLLRAGRVIDGVPLATARRFGAASPDGVLPAQRVPRARTVRAAARPGRGRRAPPPASLTWRADPPGCARRSASTARRTGPTRSARPRRCGCSPRSRRSRRPASAMAPGWG